MNIHYTNFNVQKKDQYQPRPVSEIDILSKFTTIKITDDEFRQEINTMTKNTNV